MSLIMGKYLQVQHQTKITYTKEPYLSFTVPVQPFFSDMHLALGDETFCFWFQFFSEEKGYIRRVELGSKCCFYDLELVTPHINLLRGISQNDHGRNPRLPIWLPVHWPQGQEEAVSDRGAEGQNGLRRL